MPEPDAKIAVLIDADNTSPKHLTNLLDELSQYGRATVKRAYGDWTTDQLSGWKKELNQRAISPVQQFAYTTGKNATDSALIIDAMDLLYSGNVDAFALVSSDSDFTRLATRLRESGKTVYGLGMRKTPVSLVAAVDRFIFLELLGDQPDVTADTPPDAAPLRNLQSILTKAVNRAAQDDGSANLGAIGTQLRSADASFDPRLYGFDRLITMVKAQSFLSVTGTGSMTRVSLKGGGRTTAKKAPAKKAAAEK